MIALIPCGGQATRIQRLPKFLLPCPGGYLLKRLCDQMARLPMQRIVILVSSTTYSLVRPYAPGDAVIVCRDRSSMADAIYTVKADIDTEQIVVVGMPDTYWTDDTILLRLVARLLNEPQAIVAAALWRIDPDQRHKYGMCSVEAGEVLGVVDKPVQTTLEWAWGALAWRKAFWQYLQAGDAHMGVALQRAIDAGEIVHAVEAEGAYWDAGTADDYFAMIRALVAPEVAG